jgi:hypothetical protein
MPPYADDKPAYDNGPDALGKLIPDRTLTEVCVCLSVPPHHVQTSHLAALHFFSIFFQRADTASRFFSPLVANPLGPCTCLH